ncbi:unnamed protein product [Penicillium roqueforti FM164]|uniref:Genomic scaffold, ProqFM164S03 n=1 Tax=Penicillium roqueforti (strain FM164) TaxID=1365484 RepID=W6QKI5_PENRF|nr:unnamed protein product [Penicillium roqueforti FM164]
MIATRKLPSRLKIEAEATVGRFCRAELILGECGNKTLTFKQETCSKDFFMDRVVGYYEGWATHRRCHESWPEQIRDIDLYSRLTSAKASDKDLKVMMARQPQIQRPWPSRNSFFLI